MKSNKSTYNQKGFSILEVVIAASLMSVVILSSGIALQSQIQSANYIEDKLSAVNLQQEINLLLRDNATCLRTMNGLSVVNPRTAIIRNADGSTLFDPANQSANEFERLNISAINLSNVNISAPSSAGTVRLSISTQRQRKGGGPSTLRPATISVSAVVDAANRITDCSTDPLAVTPPPTPVAATPAAPAPLPGCSAPGVSLKHGQSKKNHADTCPLLRCIAGVFSPPIHSCKDVK